MVSAVVISICGGPGQANKNKGPYTALTGFGTRHLHFDKAMELLIYVS